MTGNASDRGSDNAPDRGSDRGSDLPEPRRGMFGVTGSGDTSGYGRLVRREPPRRSSPRPYGGPGSASDRGPDGGRGYFDEVVDELERVVPDFGDAIERVVVHRGELTLHVKRDRLVEVATKLRDEPALRFEMCVNVSGVHYPRDVGGELHADYELLSITHNRRLRLEVACSDEDPHLPSVVGVYPTADWHERETWDFYGVVFDGHPALTRIEMPDDWPGHPQRKDYPLGGVPVEYRGAEVPPPEERRSYA
ncbi:MAG: NADH-quinone oxidoreductase subunit C [Streptosporangiaceae bacterium]